MNGNSLWQERPWLVVSASLWLADEINVGWKKIPNEYGNFSNYNFFENGIDMDGITVALIAIYLVQKEKHPDAYAVKIVKQMPKTIRYFAIDDPNP